MTEDRLMLNQTILTQISDALNYTRKLKKILKKNKRENDFFGVNISAF